MFCEKYYIAHTVKMQSNAVFYAQKRLFVNIGKEEVGGSNPLGSSNENPLSVKDSGFLCCGLIICDLLFYCIFWCYIQSKIQSIKLHCSFKYLYIIVYINVRGYPYIRMPHDLLYCVYIDAAGTEESAKSMSQFVGRENRHGVIEMTCHIIHKRNAVSFVSVVLLHIISGFAFDDIAILIIRLSAYKEVMKFCVKWDHANPCGGFRQTYFSGGC